MILGVFLSRGQNEIKVAMQGIAAAGSTYNLIQHSWLHYASNIEVYDILDFI